MNSLESHRVTISASIQFHASRKKSKRRATSLRRSSTRKNAPKAVESASKTSRAWGHTSAECPRALACPVSSAKLNPAYCASVAMRNAFAKMTTPTTASNTGELTSLHMMLRSDVCDTELVVLLRSDLNEPDF